MRWRCLLQTIEPALSWRLDLIRGLAASAVLFGHLRDHQFTAYRDLEVGYAGALNYVLYGLTHFGREAVMVFFVLSGFLVGGNALVEVVNKGRLNLGRYILARGTRMYVVLLPALLLGGMLDVAVGNSAYTTRLEGSVFFGNLAFLQTICVPCFGSNAPLWSLANEFWYYMLWPLFLAVPVAGKRRVLHIVLLLLALVGMSVVMPRIMELFPLWLLGVGLRVAPPWFGGAVWKYVFLAALGGACIWAARQDGLLADMVVGLTFAGFLWHWITSARSVPRFLPGFSVWLASFSFTLYAIHYPLIKWIYATFRSASGWQIPSTRAGPIQWAVLLLVAAVVYAVAWIVYWFTERRTYAVRSWLRRRLFPA